MRSLFDGPVHDGPPPVSPAFGRDHPQLMTDVRSTFPVLTVGRRA